MNLQGRKEIILHKRFIKCYKKNTIATFFSFALTFMLLTTMLVLIHTNHRIANIQDKTLFTPSDCCISKLSKQQIEQLKSDKSIDHLAVEEDYYSIYTRNNQTLFLRSGDDVLITMMAKVIEGRMPKENGEVVAEKWVLLNLGIELVLNQNFTVEDEDKGQSKTFKLVGILSDMSSNKKYGMINLYTPLGERSDTTYSAYIHFKDNIDYSVKKKSLIAELKVKEKQIKKCPARENYNELYRIDVKVISVILIICMVVFYGIYRIASITREKQYGILRAIGMKRRQLKNMILLELYQIYGVSVPVGIAIGLLLALFIVTISGDKDTIVYLYNKRVYFTPVIPIWQILFCIIGVAFLVGIAGYMTERRVAHLSVIEAISGVKSNGRNHRSRFRIGKSNSKISTLFHFGCKYIFRDMKTSSFVVLTICLGVTLFTGLAYRTKVLKIYRDDTKELWYLNGQYQMSMLSFNNMDQGISRQSAFEIQNMQQVTSIKTESGIPIRVIDEDNIERNDIYYNELNANLKKIYGYENRGNDGKNQIYKSILYGYNTTALKELKKYIISGDYNPNKIEEDEIILSILRMDDTKQNEFPGAYKEGTPLMQYKVGDKIQIKYRADLKTDTEDYENLTDSDAKYIYKTYKVKAIVYFEYIFDCNRIVYPLLITSDQQIQKIAPNSCFQCMYIDGNSSMNLKEQMSLEQQLIKIGSRNKNVSTRSIISEINQNEMFYHKQMIYVYGIAIVSFILVLINMINNLRYRMQTRTREICMLRAIGMSVNMTKQMLLFENVILGIVSIALAFVISQPVLRYLYKISDMKAMGHIFEYDYVAFAVVSLASLLICVILSYRILKSWKTRYIMEGIGNIE